MTIYSGFTHWKLWFSIVTLVYQRVHPFVGDGDYGRFNDLPWIGLKSSATLHEFPFQFPSFRWGRNVISL